MTTNKPALGIFAPDETVASMASLVQSGRVSVVAKQAEQCFGRFANTAAVYHLTYGGDADDAMVPIFDFARKSGPEIVVFITDLVCDNVDALCKAVAQMPRDTFLAIVPLCETVYDAKLARKLDTMSPTGSRVAIYGTEQLVSLIMNHTELYPWLEVHGLAAGE